MSHCFYVRPWDTHTKLLLPSAGGVIGLKESMITWPGSGLTSISHGFVSDFRQAERKDCLNQEGAFSTPLSPFPLFVPSLSLLLRLPLWSGTCCPFLWAVTTWPILLQSPALWLIAVKLLAFNWPPLLSSRVPCPCDRDGCCLWSRGWFANYKIAIILCTLILNCRSTNLIDAWICNQQFSSCFMSHPCRRGTSERWVSWMLTNGNGSSHPERNHPHLWVKACSLLPEMKGISQGQLILHDFITWDQTSWYRVNRYF